MEGPAKLSKQDRVQLAMTVYRNNDLKLPVRKIARQHGIAESTLRGRINGAKSYEVSHQQFQRLTFEQEEALADWILLMASWGWPPRVNQIRFMAMELLRSNQQDDDLRVNWIQRFLHRHTKLNSVFSQALNKERAATHNEDLINGWFSLYSKVLEDYDLQPSDIYNMNEKGFAMRIAGKCRVICSREQRVIMTQDGNRKWVSLIECVSSDRVVLRAWFIFKGKVHQKAWFNALKNVNDDVVGAKKSRIAVSDNEWINNDIGLGWLQKCFEPKTAKRQQGKFRLLIIDGHASHLTSEAIMFCENNHINGKQHTECLSQIGSSTSESYSCSIKASYRRQTSSDYFFRNHHSKLKRCITFNTIHPIQRDWSRHAYEANGQQ